MKSKSGSAAVSADPKDHGKAAEKKKTSTGPVTPAKEPHSKPSGGSSAKRAKDEIDDIFSSKPAKKVAAAEKAGGGGGGVGAGADGGVGKDGGALSALAAQVKEAREKQPQGKRPKVEGSKDDIFGESAGKARKKVRVARVQGVARGESFAQQQQRRRQATRPSIHNQRTRPHTTHTQKHHNNTHKKRPRRATQSTPRTSCGSVGEAAARGATPTSAPLTATAATDTFRVGAFDPAPSTNAHPR